MAEFLWTFAVQEVLKKTVKRAGEQVGMAWGFKDELSKMKDSLVMAQAIVRDVEKMKVDLDSLKLWVKKLQDIVFKADILLDELAYEDVRRKVEIGKDRMVRNFFSFSKNFFAFRLKMVNEITTVTKKLDELVSTKCPLACVATTFNETETDLNQVRETDSFPDEIGAIGREIEVSNIVDKLLALKNQESLVVLSIVGTGGLGKTTLVKEVFHHDMIRKNFDTTIWVCVSDHFKINKILRAIVGFLNPTFGGSDERELILRELKSLLRVKKYFLVLDDVWNEEPVLWNELRACLLKISQNVGNAIVVTTRSDKVVEIMKTNYRHRLRQLSDDHCWSLFQKCAFGSDLSIIPDVIRERLVKKFGGIPLVVKVLGGMVKSCKNDDELQSTLENLVRIELRKEDLILSTIKLSVDRLPSSSLKQCYAYCSNFPPDFCFYKEALVQMWIAQGFIQLPDGSNVTMEDIGVMYFDILLSRSLFQDVFKDNRGKIIYCKMHDHIHEVACSISNNQNLRRHLVTNGKSEGDEVLSIRQRRRIVYCCENVHFDNRDMIINFIYLRVLIIDYGFITELSDTIGKLKHLRYLDISKSRITTLPKSIVLLYNLQTLKLGCDVKLPVKLRKLVNLRHLEFDFVGQLTAVGQLKEMPKHLSRLTQLQTLSIFVVGFDEGRKIEELGPLKDLKGKLSLLNLEQVKSKKEAKAANLVRKENISDLLFEWSVEREDYGDNDLNVLKGLQPHENLRALRIHNFAGELLPNCIFVENLVELNLDGCKKCETLPTLGQLSKLEVLKINELSALKSIGSQFYGNYYDSRTLFPRLKRLDILQMDSLEQWEEVAALTNSTAFPHLESLTICSCLKLTNIPNIFTTHGQRLEADTVNARLFSSFQSPPKLKSLCIYNCTSLIKLPNWLEFCSSLVDLCIGDFHNDISPSNLRPPNLQNMPNLSLLRLENFHNLPEGLGGIHNLKTLIIEGPMQDYDWSGFIPFNSLEVLELHEIRTVNLTHLPRQLMFLTNLRSLYINNFNGLESLPEWLGNVTSLETLELCLCKNLKNLSSNKAMSNLTKLNHLRVLGCSRLEVGEGGVEREKVSHVPNIFVL
ncbi:putative disease resistance protein RGA3 [Cucurbita maxima]|uniref:Disease resistance protein RGA3 n=1 Tax=Cucurbita maxima TaxID=3661 RepID=A0A6J1ID61_CUCMA|nr:putative disease resistance protein RGA3 [Cucurbita maxima]